MGKDNTRGTDLLFSWPFKGDKCRKQKKTRKARWRQPIGYSFMHQSLHEATQNAQPTLHKDKDMHTPKRMRSKHHTDCKYEFDITRDLTADVRFNY